MATLLLLAGSGCAFHPRAQNPLPGVFRVAVVPFGDKTGGVEGLDTNRITELFASELQRIPTYEVVPVQEVREVLGPYRMNTNQPELAFALARSMHVQAIIVGDVVEYDPYYPPRLGLHCEMYAMVTGEPEAVILNTQDELRFSQIPDNVPPFLRPFAAPFYAHRKGDKHAKNCGKKDCPHCGKKTGGCDKCGSDGKGTPGNGPGTGSPSVKEKGSANTRENATAKVRQVSAQAKPDGIVAEEYSPGRMPANGITAVSEMEMEPGGDKPDGSPVQPGDPVVNGQQQILQAVGASIAGQSGEVPDYRYTTMQLENPRPIVEPWVIRHSRIFEGENLGLVRKLRHYYFFRKDERGGDWVGYTERTEDFNRFCCNMMIYEMLEAAGGKWETLKGFYFPHPWEPWPWR